jgi:hypothetical protein
MNSLLSRTNDASDVDHDFWRSSQITPSEPPYIELSATTKSKGKWQHVLNKHGGDEAWVAALLALSCIHFDKKGATTRGLRTMAHTLRCAVNTLRKYLGQAETAYWLRIDKPPSEGKATSYQLCFPTKTPAEMAPVPDEPEPEDDVDDEDKPF